MVFNKVGYFYKNFRPGSRKIGGRDGQITIWEESRITRYPRLPESRKVEYVFVLCKGYLRIIT